ncbi:MAG: hypothetical protein ACRC37_02090 [Lentisphaeria bacterium]
MSRWKKIIHTNLEKYCLDFVVGSSHELNGKYPYLKEFYEGRTEKEAYTEYFKLILQNG